MSDMMQVTTILSCKNSMVREGLKHVLSKTRFQVYPEDLTKSQACSTPLQDPLLFIVDANLYPTNIADGISSLKEGYPEARVVILADNFALDGMMAALRAGADGYCLATIGCEALLKYLDLVMLGEVVFPSALFLSAMADFGVPSDMNKPHASIEPAAALHSGHSQEALGLPVRTLSSREAEILQCLTQGAPNKVIARKLDVAEATVKVHIKAILRKIRVANRTQAAMWAVAHLPAVAVDDAWSVTKLEQARLQPQIQV